MKENQHQEENNNCGDAVQRDAAPTTDAERLPCFANLGRAAETVIALTRHLTQEVRAECKSYVDYSGDTSYVVFSYGVDALTCDATFQLEKELEIMRRYYRAAGQQQRLDH